MKVYALFGYSYEGGCDYLIALFSTKEKAVKHIEKYYKEYVYDPEDDDYDCTKNWDTGRIHIEELDVE